MDRPVKLIPLVCIKCSTPIPAQPGEVAWVCSVCQQGLELDEQKGLLPLEVQYQTGIAANARGKPYWVVNGQVSLQREVYGGGKKDAEAAEFWSVPRRFIIPAYSCPVDTLTTLGPKLLLQPPQLQPGPAAAFEPVVLAKQELQGLAEFIVVAVEADRKDKLKTIKVKVQLSTPQLWILP